MLLQPRDPARRASPFQVAREGHHTPKRATPIMVGNIRFQATCPESGQVVSGRVHVAYVAGVRSVMPSQVVRVVDRCAASFESQTRMTDAIARQVAQCLDADDVGVWVEARHTCAGCSGTVITQTLSGNLGRPDWRTWVAAYTHLSGTTRGRRSRIARV